MRGKVIFFTVLDEKVRITPAHAGKSSGGYTHANHIQDHPRTCGEKVHQTKNLKMHLGSPPHMRGKDD